MRRRPEEQSYYGDNDDATEAFFREAAAKERLTYHAWCDKYGIMDTAALRSVRRHEAIQEESSLATYEHESKGRANDVNRQGRYTHRWARRVTNDSADRNWQIDPPFAVRLTSDFESAPESPAKRRPGTADNDAAAE